MNFDPNSLEHYRGCLFMRTKGAFNGRIYMLVFISAPNRPFALIDLSVGIPWTLDANPFGNFEPDGWHLMPTGTTTHVITKNTGQYELVEDLDEGIDVEDGPNIPNPFVQGNPFAEAVAKVPAFDDEFLEALGLKKPEPPEENEQEII